MPLCVGKKLLEKPTPSVFFCMYGFTGLSHVYSLFAAQMHGTPIQSGNRPHSHLTNIPGWLHESQLAT